MQQTTGTSPKPLPLTKITDDTLGLWRYNECINMTLKSYLEIWMKPVSGSFPDFLSAIFQDKQGSYRFLENWFLTNEEVLSLVYIISTLLVFDWPKFQEFCLNTLQLSARSQSEQKWTFKKMLFKFLTQKIEHLKSRQRGRRGEGGQIGSRGRGWNGCSILQKSHHSCSKCSFS